MKNTHETKWRPASLLKMKNLIMVFLKVGPTTSLLVCFVILMESTCEIKKKAFYFTLKDLFVLEILTIQKHETQARNTFYCITC